MKIYRVFDAVLIQFNKNYNGMTEIPGGEFQMGLNNPKARVTGEFPRKRVTVETFKLDKFPVTNAQFWSVQVIG